MLTPQPCSKQPAMSQVNTHANIHVGQCFVLSTRCRYDTVVLRQIQVFLALFEPLDVP